MVFLFGLYKTGYAKTTRRSATALEASGLVEMLGASAMSIK